MASAPRILPIPVLEAVLGTSERGRRAGASGAGANGAGARSALSDSGARSALAASGGDSATSLANLYESISRPVLSVATALLGDAVEAEDVLHDVYLKVAAGLGRWRGDGELSTWVYRITVNECLSLKRKLRRRVRVLGATPRPQASAGPRGERLLLAQGFLDRLDARTRTVVVLKYVEELTFEEVAAVVGEPVGTVKALASRALREGAQRLERE